MYGYDFESIFVIPTVYQITLFRDTCDFLTSYQWDHADVTEEQTDFSKDILFHILKN